MLYRRTLSMAGVLLLALTSTIAGQEAAPADVESEDAIIAALYDVISGPAGEARDWDRFRSLMHADAKLIPSGRGRDGATGARFLSPEEYIQLAGTSLEQQGFFEDEIHRSTEAYGNIRHAFSTYTSKRTLDGEIFARGINSIQLLNDGSRWWIINVFWQSESNDAPIPARYLPGS